MSAFPSYQTKPCKTLKAIGQGLGFKVDKTFINGVIYQKLEKTLQESESNCVLMITPSLPIIITLNQHILKTHILAIYNDKLLDNRLLGDVVSDTKKSTDMAFLLYSYHYHTLSIVERIYDLQNPKSLTQLEQHIKTLQDNHKRQEAQKWQELLTSTTSPNSNATSSSNF